MKFKGECATLSFSDGIVTLLVTTDEISKAEFDKFQDKAKSMSYKVMIDVLLGMEK